jgi:hypothetical protein
MILNKKIGVIVDGDGDVAALSAKFKNDFRILKTDGPRGHSALCNKIVQHARKQVNMLRVFKCEVIIILLDFENRNCAVESFIRDLYSSSASIFPDLNLQFAIANRMLENWFLADIENLSRSKAFLKEGLKQKNYEGSNGKEVLKKYFKHGYTYSETVHGPQLFILIRDEVAIRNSSSYKKFIELLN